MERICDKQLILNVAVIVHLFVSVTIKHSGRQDKEKNPETERFFKSGLISKVSCITRSCFRGILFESRSEVTVRAGSHSAEWKHSLRNWTLSGSSGLNTSFYKRHTHNKRAATQIGCNRTTPARHGGANPLLSNPRLERLWTLSLFGAGEVFLWKKRSFLGVKSIVLKLCVNNPCCVDSCCEQPHPRRALTLGHETIQRRTGVYFRAYILD